VDRLVSSDFLDHLLPFLALAALLAVLVLAINVLGRRLERHDEWLALLDVRVGNLHKDRKATWARQLERPFGAALEVTERAPLVPPPLPPRAPTLEAIDWEEELVKTEEMMKKDTGRYPLGIPPTEKKGPNDDP
jgi:hypothetical protein